MARYVMVLRGATSLRGALEGVGPEIEAFLGPEMARAKRVPFGPKKVEKSKPLSISAIKNNWYIASFM